MLEDMPIAPRSSRYLYLGEDVCRKSNDRFLGSGFDNRRFFLVNEVGQAI